MTSLSLYEASISVLQDAISRGQVSSEEIAQTFVERINAYDQRGPALNAVVFLNPNALADAKSLDKEREQSGVRGPLHGIPIVFKDNIDIAGWPTHAGCRGLDGLVPKHDAEVITRLREAGAVLLAKTALHELAAGITTVSSHHGRTRNPYDATRNPGGSSGGTSAAVAARFACIGMATDTCGSVRYPAAHCSLVGLRVTQGRTCMRGIAPLCLTQDVVGPIARCVRDLATVLDVVVDKPLGGQFIRGLDANAFDGKRIGRLDTLFTREGADLEVCQIVNEAIEQLSELKAEAVDLELPTLVPLLDMNFIVLLGDLPKNLESYLSNHPNAPVKTLEELHATGTIHPEVEPGIAIACSMQLAVSEKYREAIQNRDRIRKMLVEAMDASELACLAYPTILQTAVRLGESQPEGNAHVSANSGLPAISMPVGFTKEGLPVGLELLGRPDSDVELVAMAYALEKQRGLSPLPAKTPALRKEQSS